jgi:hypothetical protein
MAKELPYFKFEPSEWENGNIQICSREAKGLFIDLCSIYWSRLGELPYALALQKHCNGDATLIQELKDADILQVNEQQIIIEFLDEQLDEFQKTSEKRRKAANKRWNDASALQKQSKSNAIREDKRREDKNIYRKFAHLKITLEEVDKLVSEGWNKEQIDDILDRIENYRKNTNYKSLLSTSRNWLKTNYPLKEKTNTELKIVDGKLTNYRG